MQRYWLLWFHMESSIEDSIWVIPLIFCRIAFIIISDEAPQHHWETRWVPLIWGSGIDVGYLARVCVFCQRLQRRRASEYICRRNCFYCGRTKLLSYSGGFIALLFRLFCWLFFSLVQPRIRLFSTIWALSSASSSSPSDTLDVTFLPCLRRTREAMSTLSASYTLRLIFFSSFSLSDFYRAHRYASESMMSWLATSL